LFHVRARIVWNVSVNWIRCSNLRLRTTEYYSCKGPIAAEGQAADTASRNAIQNRSPASVVIPRPLVQQGTPRTVPPTILSLLDDQRTVPEDRSLSVRPRPTNPWDDSLIRKQGYFMFQEVSDNTHGFTEVKKLRRSNRTDLCFHLEKRTELKDCWQLLLIKQWATLPRISFFCNS
jgi:hypothetical protein